MLWGKRRRRNTARRGRDAACIPLPGPEAKLVPPSNVFHWNGAAGTNAGWLCGDDWEQGKAPYRVSAVVFGQHAEPDNDVREAPLTDG